MSCPPEPVIGLIVSDMAASLDFYRRLGLEFPDDPDPGGAGHVETTLPAGIRFALDTAQTIRSFDPDWTEPSGGHRKAVAFLCDSPRAVDELYRLALEERLRERNQAKGCAYASTS